ncbi:MAG: ArnT family glycosyltransferase [Candidatus Limnocylindrales bacterium]
MNAASAARAETVDGSSGGAGRWRDISWEALLVGLGLFAVLTAFVGADPTNKATFSIAPFTDEAFNVANARNVVQLGHWSTDEWNLYLVNLPFSLIEAAWFWLVGVGIVQARLVAIVCVSLTATALVWGLRGVVGRAAAAFSGVAFAASGLILFYGRLAFLEDLVVLAMTLGTMVLARDSRPGVRGGALSGLCYAMAIGTKPNALFPIVGILLAIGLIWGWRDPGMRRWIAGASAVILAAGLLWAIVIWLPNRTAVAVDVKIWPPYQWNLTPAALLGSIKGYLVGGESDFLFGYLLLPLIVLSAAGVVAIAALRKRLGEAEARLAAAAFAWAAFGFGILMLVSYRPNRYVVPLVPAIAILAAIGLHLVVGWLRERLAAVAAADGAAAAAVPDVPPRAARHGGGMAVQRAAPNLLIAAVIVGAAVPGLVWYGRWARSATYELVAIQDQFANAVPAGQVVAGRDSALFLMRSNATTTIVGLANTGDLYAQGVRWYLEPADAGAPAGVSEATWASKERIMCAEYGGTTECLFHVR